MRPNNQLHSQHLVDWVGTKAALACVAYRLTLRDAMKRLPSDPEGYRELCAQLQQERNPDRFCSLLDQIDALLTEHERRAALEPSCDEPAQGGGVRLGNTLQTSSTHGRDLT
jgi:hypothetical protein